ncbi:hypothetical protein MTR_0127s0050 [Medicago truncatula]|uniref:Uncharacterized protein n=1 Tax=Medicago truncatula TaxID=3880 RepID=A0A072TGZ2_MEDTR|nr:hypothetical protein MTR_0127s0050 [Medicago truncatula]
MAFRADIFAESFCADPKILRNQLHTKVLPGNLNPWENPHETDFLRNVGRNPQKMSQEKSAGVATTAAVNKQYEHGSQRDGDTDMSSYETKYADRENNTLGSNSEGERKFDRSENNDSTKSGSALDAVEYDNLWEKITMDKLDLFLWNRIHNRNYSGKFYFAEDFSTELVTKFQRFLRKFRRFPADFPASFAVEVPRDCLQ